MHRPMRYTSVFTLVLSLAAASLLTACTGTRPLHIVEQSATLHYDKAEYDAALVDYKEYTERQPENVQMRYGLAQTYLAMGMPLDAAREMAIVYDVLPTNDDYVDAYAEAMLQAGQRDQLVTFLQRQVGERGRIADYMRQGKFLVRLGNLDEAKTALRIAAQMDRGQTVGPQLALADFYHAISDRDNELRRLSMALYLEPMHQGVQDRIRALGEFPGPALAQAPEEAIMDAENRRP